MLRSQANLVASLSAPWSEIAREAARVILSRIAAEEEARTTRELRADVILAADALRDAEEKFGARARFRNGDPVTFSCPAQNVGALADFLIAKGATRVASARLDYLFHAENLLWSRLAARIG
jgi:ATP phosphoribosyltransferase